jgi:hypothetical protein
MQSKNTAPSSKSSRFLYIITTHNNKEVKDIQVKIALKTTWYVIKLFIASTPYQDKNSCICSNPTPILSCILFKSICQVIIVKEKEIKL